MQCTDTSCSYIQTNTQLGQACTTTSGPRQPRQRPPQPSPENPKRATCQALRSGETRRERPYTPCRDNVQTTEAKTGARKRCRLRHWPHVGTARASERPNVRGSRPTPPMPCCACPGLAQGRRPGLATTNMIIASEHRTSLMASICSRGVMPSMLICFIT